MRSWGRQALRGNWGVAVLGSILYVALLSLPLVIFIFMFQSDVLMHVSNMYTLIVIGPLYFGYLTFFISIFRRKYLSPMEIFSGFERFFKALGLMVVMNIFVLLWSLLFFIPGIIASIRYSMAFFIFVDNPEMGIMEIISESKRMMGGNKWKYFCLQLSFIGWGLLIPFTFGIGYFWFMPYLITSTVGFYEVANGNLRPYHPSLTAGEVEQPDEGM